MYKRQERGPDLRPRRPAEDADVARLDFFARGQDGDGPRRADGHRRAVRGEREPPGVVVVAAVVARGRAVDVVEAAGDVVGPGLAGGADGVDALRQAAGAAAGARAVADVRGPRRGDAERRAVLRAAVVDDGERAAAAGRRAPALGLPRRLAVGVDPRGLERRRAAAF